MTLYPNKIVFVITDLWGGGAEAMLTRLVTTQPRLADEITVVSLLRGGPHDEQLRSAGITVFEPSSNAALAVLRGVIRLARHIARDKPDIVQGFMYHGDLAALVALVTCSPPRKFSRLAPLLGHGCPSAGGCGGMRLSWPVLSANSAAGMKAHLRSTPRRNVFRMTPARRSARRPPRPRIPPIPRRCPCPRRREDHACSSPIAAAGCARCYIAQWKAKLGLRRAWMSRDAART
ncbi:MAG: glycosyltransferase [Xanthobacteraceae bacterium]